MDGRAGSDLPPERMRSMRDSLSASRSMNRQPTIMWPGAVAGRSDATRTSPLISSAKKRPWNISRSPIRSTRPRGEGDAALRQILERALDAVAVDDVAAVDRDQPGDAADRHALVGAARGVDLHLQHPQGDQGQVGRVVRRAVDHHRSAPTACRPRRSRGRSAACRWRRSAAGRWRWPAGRRPSRCGRGRRRRRRSRAPPRPGRAAGRARPRGTGGSCPQYRPGGRDPLPRRVTCRWR